MTAPSRRQLLRLAAACAAAPVLRPGGSRAAPVSAWRPAAVDKQLITRLASPYCAEPAPGALVRRPLTPLEHLYVLNHGEVPEVEIGDYRLRVDGLVARALAWTLPELVARLPRRTVIATLQCAGNRRIEHHRRRPVDDPLLWHQAALGTVAWTGVALRDLLAVAGVLPGAGHVLFEGLDRSAAGDVPFAGSIPIGRVLDPALPPVLLAHHAGGRPLPRVHGFPLRAVVPGYVGARSVKWLGRVTVSRAPSESPHFQRGHRLDDAPIYRFPMSSAICLPGDGAQVEAGGVELRGYAVPRPGGPDLARVELSGDDGARWQPAELGAALGPGAWRLWRARLALRPGRHTVAVRAVDRRGRAQPRESPWNPGGYLYDGWHRLRLEVR